MKAITAALSVATAFITLKLAPLASEVATPEETARTNQILRDEIEARKEAERQVLLLLETKDHERGSDQLLFRSSARPSWRYAQPARSVA